MMPSLEKKSGPRILIVDDDPNEMRSLVIGLRLEGFDAVGAASAMIALDMLSHNPFALVIVDLMMPEMNGLQLARAIRAAHPSVLTMLMSAYHLSPIQLARADTGVVGFIPKPFSFEELIRFMRIKLEVDAHSPAQAVSSSYVSDSGLNAPVEIPVMATVSAQARLARFEAREVVQAK